MIYKNIATVNNDLYIILSLASQIFFEIPEDLAAP